MLILSGFARFCKLNTKVGLLFCQSFRGPTFEICRRDEIGTRSRLKICREQSLTGSSPVGGTTAQPPRHTLPAPLLRGGLSLCVKSQWLPGVLSIQSVLPWQRGRPRGQPLPAPLKRGGLSLCIESWLLPGVLGSESVSHHQTEGPVRGLVLLFGGAKHFRCLRLQAVTRILYKGKAPLFWGGRVGVGRGAYPAVRVKHFGCLRLQAVTGILHKGKAPLEGGGRVGCASAAAPWCRRRDLNP